MSKAKVHAHLDSCLNKNIVVHDILIHLLCTQCHSFQDIADILNTNEADLRKQLRIEILNIRNRKKEKEKDLNRALANRNTNVG